MSNKLNYLPTLTILIPALALLLPRASAGEKKTGKRQGRVIKIVKQVKPAVVFIEGSRKKPRKYQDPTRLGLGVIVDPKGVVVLPLRIVDEASKISQLVLSDGTTFMPKAIFSDPKTKVAVIKLESKKPLPHVPYGNSDKVKVGDYVLSLDWPSRRERDFSLDWGIVAGKPHAGNSDKEHLLVDSSRSFPSEQDLLFNLDGKLIGIWNRRLALPSTRVKKAVEQLLKKK
jgi:serine protease Do